MFLFLCPFNINIFIESGHELTPNQINGVVKMGGFEKFDMNRDEMLDLEEMEKMEDSARFIYRRNACCFYRICGTLLCDVTGQNGCFRAFDAL